MMLARRLLVFFVAAATATELRGAPAAGSAPPHHGCAAPVTCDAEDDTASLQMALDVCAAARQPTVLPPGAVLQPSWHVQVGTADATVSHEVGAVRGREPGGGRSGELASTACWRHSRAPTARAECG